MNYNRQELAAALRSQRLPAYTQHLDEQLRWLEEARKIPPGELIPSKIVNGLLIPGNVPNPRRKAEAVLLEAIGAEGRARLLDGRPVVLRIGDAPPAARADLRYLLPITSQEEPPDRLDQYHLILALAGNPVDFRNTYLMRGLLAPDGLPRGRYSIQRMKGARRPAFVGPPYRLPTHNNADRSWRVRFRIPPLPAGREHRSYRWLNLDTCLALLAKQTGLRFIADGYIRPARAFRPLAEARELPIEQLLTSLTYQWNCDWRWLDRQETTVLVRSRCWWLEDLADVPEPLFRKYRSRLGSDAEASIEDLLEVAELNFGQVHKLVESGVCPGASGVVQPGFYELTGPKPCLQFYNRLPKDLKRRVRQPEGLLLADAPRALIEDWLAPTLISHVGALAREEQDRLTFYIAPARPGDDARFRGRWVLGFKTGERDNPFWSWWLQPEHQPFDAVPDPLSELLAPQPEDDLPRD